MNFVRNNMDTYVKWFQDFDVENLLKQERVLSELIDGDLLLESLLIDEAILMLELIRDECVARLSATITDGAGGNVPPTQCVGEVAAIV